jgi:predicted metal-dependent hydrolase
MGDSAGAVGDEVEKGTDSRLHALVAVAVSITATFMAVCNVKDGNVNQAMQQAQARSVDAWAFYQAKSTKQHLAEAVIDQLETQRAIAPDLSPEAQALLDQKIADHQAKARLYEKEKAEIKAQAEGHQREYDALNFHDDQFDLAEASLSVAIALLGITALTQKRWMLGVVAVFLVFGAVMGLAGFLGSSLHPDFLVKILS